MYEKNTCLTELCWRNSVFICYHSSQRHLLLIDLSLGSCFMKTFQKLATLTIPANYVWFECFLCVSMLFSTSCCVKEPHNRHRRQGKQLKTPFKQSSSVPKVNKLQTSAKYTAFHSTRPTLGVITVVPLVVSQLYQQIGGLLPFLQSCQTAGGFEGFCIKHGELNAPPDPGKKVLPSCISYLKKERAAGCQLRQLRS